MLEPKKITLGGKEYLIGRMSLFDAMLVSKLIAPVIPVILNEALGKAVEVIAKSKAEDGAGAEEKLSEVASLLLACQPILREVAQMKREDFETVVRMCLGVVERKTGRTYARVCPDGVMMFDDIDQATAFTLVFHVLVRELRPFTNALLG